MNRNEWVAVAIVVIVVIGAGGYLMWDKVRPREDQVFIKDAVKKTAGGESRTVEYFIYTDKGYFLISSPVDSEAVPHVWNIAEANIGNKVIIKYYDWRVDGWGWYPKITQIHTIG